MVLLRRRQGKGGHIEEDARYGICYTVYSHICIIKEDIQNRYIQTLHNVEGDFSYRYIYPEYKDVCKLLYIFYFYTGENIV